MRSGELSRRIVIELATEAQDSYGEAVPTWSTFATVWAKVTPNRGDERFAANQIVAQADSVFRIRWQSGVTTKMRINYDGQIYDIVYMAEIGRREGLDLYGHILRA